MLTVSAFSSSVLVLRSSLGKERCHTLIAVVSCFPVEPSRQAQLLKMWMILFDHDLKFYFIYKETSKEIQIMYPSPSETKY